MTLTLYKVDLHIKPQEIEAEDPSQAFDVALEGIIEQLGYYGEGDVTITPMKVIEA